MDVNVIEASHETSLGISVWIVWGRISMRILGQSLALALALALVLGLALSLVWLRATVVDVEHVGVALSILRRSRRITM